MIEIRALQHRVLVQLLEHDDSIRQFVRLHEQQVGVTARTDLVYFPMTAVFALVTSDELDAALVLADECSWCEPYPAVLETRLAGYSYTLPANLLRTPSLRHVLSAEAARLHCRAIENLSQLSIMTRPRSIARYLLQFAREELAITQQVVAQAVGSRRETVTETFARFESNGWLQCSRSRVVIRDFTALQNFVVYGTELATA